MSPRPPRNRTLQRQQREQHHREQLAGDRKRTAVITTVGVVAVVIFAVVVGIAVTRTAATSSARASSVNAPSLQTTPAPWAPEYAHLPARLAALRLPPNGDESYHIHAHLVIFVDGAPVPVPADVGITEQLESPMHTHDTSGVIHIEASQPSPAFTLAAFIQLWGVTFSDTQLGVYTPRPGKALQVFVNGQPVADPAGYVLRRHDDVVIDYGAPGVAPTITPFTWPTGE